LFALIQPAVKVIGRLSHVYSDTNEQLADWRINTGYEGTSETTAPKVQSGFLNMALRNLSTKKKFFCFFFVFSGTTYSYKKTPIY